MKIIVTKTVCELINGDRKINKDRISISSDLEAYRKQVFKSTANCKVVRFDYEEIPE